MRSEFIPADDPPGHPARLFTRNLPIKPWSLS